MVGYTTAPGDLEMGVEEKTIVLVEKKSPTGSIWKVTVALLFVALCLGGVLLFAWHWNGRPEKMSESGRTEAVTDKKTAEKTDAHKLRQFSSRSEVAIHLEGNCDEDVPTALEWKSEQGQGFTRGGFKLVDNKIIIPQSGLYFVYSQASFRVSCSGDNEEGPGNSLTPLSHRILRFSDSIGSNASLMSAVRSVCQSTVQEDGRGWYSAIYLGAVFKLNKGDKLWTETNQLSQLETEDGKTFFGVFAL